MLKKLEYKIDESKCIFKVNLKIYPLEVLMKVAYIYIDDFYIFFDYETDNENIVSIVFSGKKELNLKELEGHVGEFLNELLHQNIRRTLSNDTKDLRNIILSRALYGTALETDSSYIESKNQNTKENSCEIEMIDCDTNYMNDNNEIAISWFEKNSKEG